MGVGTFLIAILPGNAVIGVWAVILLNVFRIIQGLGIGGEWGSAVAIVSEFAAKSKHRSIYTSIVMGTTPIGIMLAGVAFGVASDAMSSTDFIIWGWRGVFVIGAVVAVLGLALRYKISESPLFLRARERKQLAKAPAVEVLKRQWFPIILMALITAVNLAIGSIAQRPFSMNYLQTLGVSSSFASYAIAISAVAGLLVCILGGHLGDVIGRKWSMRLGIGISALLLYPSFIIMQTKNPALIVLAQIMVYTPMNLSYGNFASSFTEQFETKYRNSGAGLGYQFGAFINAMVTVAVVAPMLSFFKGPLDSWPYILAVVEVVIILGFISTFSLKETKGAELT
jgi:MFS family permease